MSTVVGFTGSSIWKYIAMFPPASGEMIDAGYQDFADRWNPILDVFDEVGVRFAHEVHPSEIAYDYYSTQRALEAIGHREAFGINWDPSHMVWQNIDPVQFIWDFRDRIYHVDCKDTKVRPRDGRRGVLGSHLPWADPRRGWDFVSTGRGDVDWEDCFRMLTTIGYDGPISIEWEDAGMDRLHGAPEALAYIRSQLFDPPATAFDAAFSQPGLSGHRALPAFGEPAGGRWRCRSTSSGGTRFTTSAKRSGTSRARANSSTRTGTARGWIPENWGDAVFVFDRGRFATNLHNDQACVFRVDTPRRRKRSRLALMRGYNNLSQYRKDTWSALEEATERLAAAAGGGRPVDAHLAAVSELMNRLSPVERYFAFPGPRRGGRPPTVHRGEVHPLRAGVASANRALVTDAFRNGVDWSMAAAIAEPWSRRGSCRKARCTGAPISRSSSSRT